MSISEERKWKKNQKKSSKATKKKPYLSMIFTNEKKKKTIKIRKVLKRLQKKKLLYPQQYNMMTMMQWWQQWDKARLQTSGSVSATQWSTRDSYADCCFDDSKANKDRPLHLPASSSLLQVLDYKTLHWRRKLMRTPASPESGLRGVASQLSCPFCDESFIKWP